MPCTTYTPHQRSTTISNNRGWSTLYHMRDKLHLGHTGKASLFNSWAFDFHEKTALVPPFVAIGFAEQRPGTTVHRHQGNIRHRHGPAVLMEHTLLLHEYTTDSPKMFPFTAPTLLCLDRRPPITHNARPSNIETGCRSKPTRQHDTITSRSYSQSASDVFSKPQSAPIADQVHTTSDRKVIGKRSLNLEI